MEKKTLADTLRASLGKTVTSKESKELALASKKASANDGRATSLALSPPVVKMIRLRPTMSKLGHLLNCSWPWGKEIEKRHLNVDEPARYGSAFHEIFAIALESKDLALPGDARIRDIALRWSKPAVDGNPDLDPDELIAHVRAAFPVLLDWLRKDNPWGVNLLRARRRVEIAVAYSPKTEKARIIAGPTEDGHEYLEAKPFEIPGTADLILDMMPDEWRKRDKAPHFIVIDHKTGEQIDTPKYSAQLYGLAKAYNSIVPHRRRIGAAIFHSPRRETPEDPIPQPTMFADEYDSGEMAVTGKKIRNAWRRIGTGSLKPGYWCPTCPAFLVCPLHADALTQLEKAPSLAHITPAQFGQLHEAIQRFTALTERLKPQMKEWLRKHEVAPRPDGKLVQLSKKSVERISKKNVIDAAGAARAEDIFAEWRAKGFLKTTEHEEMRAVTEKR